MTLNINVRLGASLLYIQFSRSRGWNRHIENICCVVNANLEVIELGEDHFLGSGNAILQFDALWLNTRGIWRKFEAVLVSKKKNPRQGTPLRYVKIKTFLKRRNRFGVPWRRSRSQILKKIKWRILFCLQWLPPIAVPGENKVEDPVLLAVAVFRLQFLTNTPVEDPAYRSCISPAHKLGSFGNLIPQSTFCGFCITKGC